jgi:heat shock protein HslJ
MTFLRSTVLMAAASTVLFGAAACTTPSTNEAAESPLTGRVWELQQIQMNDGTLIVPSSPQHYTAEFADEGEVFIRADCNRSVGQFTVEADSRLTINVGPTTLAACPDGSISSEFLQALGNANLFSFRGEELLIELQFDSGTLLFSHTPTAALVGTVWKLQQIQMSDGTLLVADPPENYTAEFLADGSLMVRADCNRGRGEFTATEDHRLSVSPIATTRAACPEGSIGTEFVQALSNASGYFFQRDSLFVDLAFDSGTMQFSAD